MRTFVVLILIGLGLLTLALVVRSGIMARKNPGRPINSAMRLAMENDGVLEFSAEDRLIISREFTGSHKQQSGLIYVPRQAGSGPFPTVGQEVLVRYEGRFLNGDIFDRTGLQDGPLKFRVGTGEVIAGWDEAFLHMRKGEKRTLVIPYWLAYGPAGRPPKIPGSATLVFEVELVEIR